MFVWDKQTMSKSQTMSYTSPAGIDTDGASHVFMIAQNGPIQTQADLTNPISFKPTFQGSLDIANTGNGYVYWNAMDNNSHHLIRYGKTSVANSQGDLLDLGTMVQLGNVAANGNVMLYQQAPMNSSQYDIFVCPYNPPCNNPTKLAGAQYIGYRAGNMIVDNNDAYWTAFDLMNHGNLLRCQVNGCNNTPTIVAQVALGNSLQPGGVAVDNTFVYFLMGDNNGTKLYRVVKQ